MRGTGKSSRLFNLSKEDAELFNELFPNFGARHSQRKPTCSESNVIRQQQPLFFKNIDLIEVNEVIESLQIKYSTDCYDINYVLVGHSKIILADLLTENFNDCLTSTIYSKCLKTAKTVPIFKEGKIDDYSD